MPELTVANYLGMLLEDPYDTRPIKKLRQLLDSEPANKNAQEPLRLIEAARGGHERRGEFLAASLLMEIESELVSDDPEFRSVLVKELGRVRRDELMDDQGARQAYELLGGRESDDPEVVQAVEQIEQAAERWREIAHRFVEEAREAADPRLKTSLLTRAASLIWQYGGEGDAQQADAIFDEALAADPSHLRTARQYALSLRARERWEDVVSVFVLAAKAARSREEKAAAWLQAARVLHRCIGDVEGAAEAYQKVLELTPTDEEALGALVQYFTDKEAWDELAAMYDDALRSRQKLESEKGMLLQLAMVHWRFRNDPESAEPYFARLRKIDAAHPGMLDFYRDQIGSEDSEGRLLTILGDALRTTTDTELQLQLARELAHRADAANRPERALEAWKLVERLSPGDMDARTALQQLYEGSGKWKALSESIRGEIEALSPDATNEKLRLLRDLIPIYRDALSLDSMLIQVYAEILSLSPHDPEALAALAELYQGSERWNELIQVLDRQAEMAQDSEERVALYLRVADLWVERFGNLNQATRPLEQVIAIQPDHPDALARLKEIYTENRKWAALFNVLGKEAELAVDPSARLDKKIEMAELCTSRLHQNAVAIRLWKEILEEAPDTPGALEALEKLAEREKDWETLAAILRRRAEQCEGQPAQVDVLQRLGVVLMERLSRPEEAVEVWEQLLERDPDNTRVRRTLRDAYVASAAWGPLEALYHPTEDWLGLGDVLDQAAAEAGEPPAVVELSLRAAEVYCNRVGEPHRAVRALERVLVADPTNERAARMLAPIYERDQKWGRYSEMLEIIEAAASAESPPADRLARLDALRRVALDRQHDPASSFAWASRAYVLFPSEPEVVAGLEESAEVAGSYEELVALFRARVDDAGTSESERIDLQRRIAAIAGERLGESQESIRQLEAILEIEPNDAEVIAVLDRLYRGERRFEDLRRLYDRRVKAVTDPAEEWVLLNEVAQIEEEQLGDLPAAAERHWQILESNPHDVDALSAVERLSQQLKQWDRLDRALEKRLQSKVSDDDRLAVYLQLADLRRLHLEDLSGALECYREALALDGRNHVAMSGLEAISAEGGALSASAIDLLEPAYSKRGEFEKLASLLRRRLDQTKGKKERRSLRLRLAELAASELGDASGAYATLESAFVDNPHDLALLDRLGGVAEAAGQHEAFARAVVGAIDSGDLDPDTEVVLCRRAAELYDHALGLPEESARFHRRVLQDDPSDTTAFAALKQLYTKQEQWNEVRGLYQQRIEATIDAGAKLDLLLQLCFLFEEILDEPKEAISSYEQALELDPTHTPSRRALQRLYGRLKRWPELAELLRRDLDEATGQEATDLAYELATLYETRLDRPSDAVDHYELVLGSSATHLRAQEGLERLMENQEERQRVARILEPIFESQGAWGELAKVLEVQLEDLTDSSSRAAHLGRLGELTERKLRDPQMAFEVYARAVREDVADGSARADLKRLASDLDRHRERAELLEAGLSSVTDEYVKTELCLELAELWEEAESEPERVERAYRQLLRQEPDNPDIVLKVSRALERIHRASGDQQALAEDLRLQLRFEESPAQREELSAQLADLLEGPLHDPDAAIEVHRERLDLDPTNEDILEALERLYEQRAHWEPLIEVLERRHELSDDELRQKALLRRVAEIFEHKLDNIENAIATYRDILSRFGSDDETLEALTRLYRATERWHELLEMIELRADTAEAVGDQIEYRFEAAELMRTKTGEEERAFDVYRELLERMPGHEPTVRALGELAQQGERSLRFAAARRLLEHYQSFSQHADQVRMLEIIAAHGDAGERVGALLQAAEASEVGLRDANAAFELTGRALLEGVAADALQRVVADYERHAIATGRFSDCIETLDAVVPELLDADLRTEVRMRAAGIAEQHLGNTGVARSQYEQILDEQPDHRASLDAVLSLVEGTGAARELVDLLRRKAELVEERDERADLFVRQAELYESDIEDLDSAIDVFDRALGENDHPAAYEGLERLYRKTRRWEDLSTLYEREIDQRFGDPATVRYELGQLCLRKLDEPWRALDQFREALNQDASHEPTIRVLEELLEQPEYRSASAELLEPLYLRRMEWDKVTAILEARLDGEQDPTQRLELLRHLGDVQESHLEDLDGALETYGRLFAEDPHDQGSQEKLTRLARSLGRWNRLAATFDATLRAIEVDDASSAALSLTTAKLYDERLDDSEKAAAYYRRALAYDPSNKQASTALATVYAKSGKWAELLELDRERESFAEDDGERVSILREIARIEAEELDAPSDAIVTHRRILEIDPSDKDATTTLDTLLKGAERWEDLAAHIEFQIDNAANPKASMALRNRLGSITEMRLGDVPRALDIYEDVLADDASYAPALEAVTRLVPHDDHGPRAVQILEPIHRQGGHWRELIAVLRAKAEQTTDSFERAETWREVAQLYQAPGGHEAKAFEAWGRALRADPSDEATRTEVDRLASALGDFAGYIAICEAAAAASDEPSLQAAFLRRVAETQDRELGDPRAAIQTFGRILEADPDAGAALDDLEGLEMMVGDWQGVAKVYELKLERSHDAETRAALLMRLGALYEEQLSDPERAVSYYQQAAGETPDDGEAYAALDRLFAAANDSDRLADVLEHRMTLEEDPAVRVEVGLRLAELYEAQLGRPQAACDALRAVLDADRDHRGALESLSRLYERQGQWPELVEVLRRRIETALHESEQVQLMHQLGNITERELDDELRAIAVYGDVLRLDESHEPSVQSLLRITKLADYREDAAAVVEPYLRAQERWNDVAALILSRADAMTDPHEKAEQLVALADVQEQGRKDPNAALDALLQSASERPENDEVIDRAQDLARDLQRWPDLAEVLLAGASATLEPERAAALYRRVSRICENELGDHAKAIDASERALSLLGDAPSILEDLDRLLEKTEQWDRVHDVVSRRLEAGEADRPSLLLRQGRLRASYLGDLEGALSAYQLVMEHESGHEDAIEAIRRLAEKPEIAESALDLLEDHYRTEGNLEEVVRLYEKRVAIAPSDADRVALLTEAAAIWENDLGRPEEAIAALRAAVQIEPRDRELFASLERLAEQSGRWDDLRGLVEEIAGGGALDRRELYELRLRSARWYRDRLSDAKAAERALVDALQLDPEPLEAHAELVALLREQQRSAELVAALRAWAVVEPVTEERTAHLREAAGIALEALSEPELAAECYQELLSIDRTEAEALRALCEIRYGQSRWNEVVGLLERRLDVASDDAERASLARKVGQVYRTHLSDSRAAIEAYEAALDFEEANTETLDALEQLYEQDDRVEALRSLLQRRCELVDDQERAELQLRLARLYEHSFRDKTAAIAMLREVVRFDPTREDAVEDLERLLEAAGAWDELVASLLSRVGDATQEQQRGLLERVAEIHDDKRHDPASAIQTYERINAEIGADETSLRALASLYERDDDWAKVADTLEHLAARLEGQTAIELCHRVADLWADRIGDREQSGRVLRAAYERFPSDRDTSERLKAHYESEGDYRALVGVLDDELETVASDQERVVLLRSISDVHRDRLDDPGTAATYLEKAVGLDREDRAALVPLCDLYMAAGRQRDAVPILRQIIESFGRSRSKELATHHHRLGQALESLGDAEGALAAYDAAFKVDLTNVQILRDLGKLTLDQGDLSRAQKSFRALLLQKLEPSSGIRKADVYYYLGDIAARQEDKRKAITMLERALAEDRSHDQASQLLAQLKG